MRSRILSYSPPASPWRKLPVLESSGGYLAYVYSDDIAAVPIRAVTKIGDNKVDPNLETMTYGLFSYCGKQARCGIVKNSYRYLFFITKWHGSRVLIGMYIIGWYASHSLTTADYALASNSAWFLESPLPLSSLTSICGQRIVSRFRTCLRLDDYCQCNKLVELITSKPNGVQRYISEIHRLERYNLFYSGYRYPSGSISESYSWECDKVKSIASIMDA